ncbi:ArgP/LysG family DNA-binding transcriptional regulator [Chitiniphilus purpureus]|uniref:ArgP/LysG family DNA-binding transcriptional regulator n=1 Tax=Chitiniphilus purpureus TaxID=2981137 RepID=A0ABY6DQ45_9NEIS|nr:ArgP/LysG family DNA-binding transcriptional regulator [Chitiniphilus sp. CD1]UXY14038.1 ArgP/LysG family DNA-binding transcriptional regulator [Chitiniphilus sp. CD1]
MLDYKLLEALEMVVRAGSFDGAAKRLHLTQSAVSQRIRLLEERIGAVLLVRDAPVRPTLAGERLLAHVRQVRTLEHDLAQQLEGEGAGWHTLRIGVNADSLAIGLLPALAPVLRAHRILLECVVDDESYTLDLLKSGEVSGCISTQAQPVAGCEVVTLGALVHVFVATPAFAQHFFGDGLTRAALTHAPAAVYGRKQSLHRRWLREAHGLEEGAYPSHAIPDSSALYAAACAGIAYAVVPRVQAAPQLADGSLLALPVPPLPIALFWHHATRQNAAAQALTEAMQTFAARFVMA